MKRGHVFTDISISHRSNDILTIFNHKNFVLQIPKDKILYFAQINFQPKRGENHEDVFPLIPQYLKRLVIRYLRSVDIWTLHNFNLKH